MTSGTRRLGMEDVDSDPRAGRRPFSSPSAWFAEDSFKQAHREAKQRNPMFGPIEVDGHDVKNPGTQLDRSGVGIADGPQLQGWVGR